MPVKGIGIFVAVLLVGIGVAIYVTTRPPDRNLDAQGRAWVEGFTAWHVDTARVVDRAEVEIGVSRGERLSQERVRPLRDCARSLARLGPPPSFLERAHENSGAACREVEYALALNQRYGRPALASTSLHLHRAGRWLTAAEVALQRELEAGG